MVCYLSICFVTQIVQLMIYSFLDKAEQILRGERFLYQDNSYAGEFLYVSQFQASRVGCYRSDTGSLCSIATTLCSRACFSFSSSRKTFVLITFLHSE